ncbi:hypothetical protein HKD37_10G028702 [Glycine soja]
MNSSTPCSLLFTLCLILIISQSPLPTNARAHGHYMIGQICKQLTRQDDKIKCPIILRANPKILRAKNYLEFSSAVLELGMHKGIEGQKFLKGLVKAKSSPAIAECANFCYDAVVNGFKGAMNELKDDPMTANYDAGVVSDGPATCERALADEHIVDPAISALNNRIMLLSAIASYAIDKLIAN